MAVEGPVISWVADHRKHHAYSDRLGDPHSPHVDNGGGWRGALRGLAHAHIGWLFNHSQRGARERLAPDLVADPVIGFVDRTFML
jgi:stearoyl-CoA desaturase (Delta-9 desaturase)